MWLKKEVVRLWEILRDMARTFILYPEYYFIHDHTYRSCLISMLEE